MYKRYNLNKIYKENESLGQLYLTVCADRNIVILNLGNILTLFFSLILLLTFIIL